MYIVDRLYFWTDVILFWGLVGIRAWSVFDCAIRRHDAFPAVDKLTKPAWLAILVVSSLFGTWLSPSPIGPLSLISVIVSAVYLADVGPLSGRSAAAGSAYRGRAAAAEPGKELAQIVASPSAN